MRFISLSLLFLLSVACARQPEPYAIRFAALSGDEPVACGDSALTDLRFFVSEVEFFDANGESVSAALQADGAWQNESVALLDLEDGTGLCQNGSAATNDRIKVVAPPAEYIGLRFTIGVPFGLNHANPLTAEPPLDDAAMHWHWRSGYKFLRAGWASDERSAGLHLGSTACRGTVGNIVGCDAPNRVMVRLQAFHPGRDTVGVDVQALLADTTGGCESGPAEPHCRGAFAALGLPFQDGIASDQTVFRVLR